MPRISPDRIKEAQASLQGMKVFSFDRLLSLLNCSTRTGRSKLKQWGAYTSYNQNGQYYTMPANPRFDKDGLWHFEGVSFSRHGNLRKTVIHLIRHSKAGLCGRRIGELVKLNHRSFLHHFRDAPGIRREKHGGVYVYFSDERDACKRQKEKRLESFALSAQALCDADAVIILAALIRRHDISAEEIMALPEIKGKRISPHAVHDFLKRHGLLKKTAAARP